MNVTGWCSYETTEGSPYVELSSPPNKAPTTEAEASAERLFCMALLAVEEELRSRKIKISGTMHQSLPFCTPILDNRYKLCLPINTWGQLMANAYHINDVDGLAYTLWTSSEPEPSIKPMNIQGYLDAQGRVIKKTNLFG